MQDVPVRPATTSPSSPEGPIIFTNSEAVRHDVHKTAVSTRLLLRGHGRHAAGDTFQLTLDEPGKYEYVCKVHAPGMAGSITVDK